MSDVDLDALLSPSGRAMTARTNGDALRERFDTPDEWALAWWHGQDRREYVVQVMGFVDSPSATVPEDRGLAVCFVDSIPAETYIDRAYGAHSPLPSTAMLPTRGGRLSGSVVLIPADQLVFPPPVRRWLEEPEGSTFPEAWADGSYDDDEDEEEDDE